MAIRCWRHQAPVDGEVIWAPRSLRIRLTNRGATSACISARHIDRYLRHTDTAVRLYLEETFIFLLLTQSGRALTPAASTWSNSSRQR